MGGAEEHTAFVRSEARGGARARTAGTREVGLKMSLHLVIMIR